MIRHTLCLDTTSSICTYTTAGNYTYPKPIKSGGNSDPNLLREKFNKKGQKFK